MSRKEAALNARTRPATIGDVEDMIKHLKTPPKTDMDLTTLIDTVAAHDSAISTLNHHAHVIDRNADEHDKAIAELTDRVTAIEKGGDDASSKDVQT